jgi:hypothetical protein
MAQKIRLSTITMPRTIPNGKVSTGGTAITPGSGEMISAADSGLGARAVEPAAAGLAWLVGAVEGAGDGAADRAELGLAAGLGAEDGLAGAAGEGTATATGAGDGGNGEGSGAGVNDSLPAVPRRRN